MTTPAANPPAPWELAAENITVQIRWFGLLVGALLVNIEAHSPQQQLVLNAILTLGGVFTLLDTWYSLRGRVFLGDYPLAISLMEALFIGVLCYHDRGLDSPFRYYYLLSVLCCAIRYHAHVTYATAALHALSSVVLYCATPPQDYGLSSLILMVVVLGWVAWAGNALAGLLKRVGDRLRESNDALQQNQAQLEARIAERSRELQEAQAHVLHQEKMAAFGLLAAGIAHEVGNPLTSISSMVQMLQKHEHDGYTDAKLALIHGQLLRIRSTLRELIEFSRPASTERAKVSLTDILDEALNIAKYYKRTRGKIATPPVPAELPSLVAVRDQLVQVFLNLVLNAIDATDKDGKIALSVDRKGNGVEVAVRDNGHGIAPADAPRLFQPYFTTKKNGTGLGLFVTRKLVQDHGGTVTFDSSPGEGTTFRVWLPLTADPTPFAPVWDEGSNVSVPVGGPSDG